MKEEKKNSKEKDKIKIEINIKVNSIFSLHQVQYTNVVIIDRCKKCIAIFIGDKKEEFLNVKIPSKQK